MGVVREFRDFAMRGNVADMAVGFVIGAAFGKIVSSFVQDVLMPPIGVLTSGLDFTQLKVTLEEAVMDAAGEVVTPAVTLNWGSFVSVVIDFVIVAFAIFMVIKVMNRMKKKEEVAPAAPPTPTKEEILLTEIRDALRAGR